MSDTIKVFESEYPVIKGLSYGWALAMHPNGPIVCNEDTLGAIDLYPSSVDMEGIVPLSVRMEAGRAWREYSHSRIQELESELEEMRNG